MVPARNTNASAVPGELALVILHCRTDQISWSLPRAVHLWNLQSSGVIIGGTLSSFKSDIDLDLLRA